MAREELSSDKIKINQKPAITMQAGATGQIASDGSVLMDPGDRVAEIVPGEESVLDDEEYMDRLKFMEEPVRIRLEPSSEKNPANVFPVWVNGKGAEVLINDRWRQITYLPVSRELTVKRKVLEVIARAKIDTINTDIIENPGQDPDNRVKRFTSPVHSFSVLQDSQKGHEWLTELRRKNY